jgi:hypothetical protein
MRELFAFGKRCGNIKNTLCNKILHSVFFFVVKNAEIRARQGKDGAPDGSVQNVRDRAATKYCDVCSLLLRKTKQDARKTRRAVFF